MLRLQASRRWFCSANLSSTFRIRSRLSEFFKHTHPDVLQNAPQKIKEENMRSLKNLNAYIDAVSQLKQIEGKLLRFYVAEKSNNKSKKYYSFEVELPQVETKIFQDAKQANQLITNITDVLNAKFMESRGIRNPNIKKASESAEKADAVFETEQDRFERLQHQVRPFKKDSDYKRQLFEERLSKKAQEAYRESERDSLMGELQQKVYFANTPANKPLMWSRLAMKESGVYRDYQEILDSLLDPKLIYFAEDLKAEDIETFKRTLLPGNFDFRHELDRQALTKMFAEMETNQPPICLYVSRGYSATDIPGFYTIPFRFLPKELVANFNKLKPAILEERAKYEHLYDTYKSLSGELKRKNGILVQFDSFKNTADVSRKVLMIKRLTKYTSPRETEFVPLDNEQYMIFCKEYHKEESRTCHFVNGKVILRIEFADSQLVELLRSME